MEARLDKKHHRRLRPKETCEVLRNPNGVTISEEPAIMPPSMTFCCIAFVKKYCTGFLRNNFLAEGDDLFLDSTTSEDGKSKFTPHSTIEQVDKEKDEEGNDINRVWKRPNVTCGQKAQDSQPPVLQPTATTGVVFSATTNGTVASESSNPALVRSEPTSNANQDFAQDVVESHEFAEGEVMCSLEELHELLDRASAPNTLASSSISNPTIDSQAIATTRATLEMNFITMAGEVQRTRMISGIQSLVDSNCFPVGTRPMIMGLLKQLEQYVPAYSKAYSEYDMGKNLTDQVEASKQLLQPKVQFCDSKEREFQELAKWKMTIEGKQAAILAEIRGAIKAIREQVEKFLLQ